MNEVNNQISDLFHAFPPLEDLFPDNSFSLQPDQESNIEERITQELPQVQQAAAHVDTLSNNKSNHEKKKKRWAKMEDNQLFALKQQKPKLSWAKIARHFPGTTHEQCSSHWNRFKQSLLRKQNLTEEEISQRSMILQELTSQPRRMQDLLNPEATTRTWTEQENKRLFALRQQESRMPWEDVARQFAGKTAEQCQNHWFTVLVPKLQIKQQLANTFPQKQKGSEESHQQLNLSEQTLPKKRKPMEEEESENDRPSKKARTQPASPFREASPIQEGMRSNHSPLLPSDEDFSGHSPEFLWTQENFCSNDLISSSSHSEDSPFLDLFEDHPPQEF